MEPDKDVLLNMHTFYTDEARHQREMMWSTARWFWLILALLFTVSFKPILEPPETWTLPTITTALIPCVLGYIVSLISVLLMRSFYRTNLIYISMFAKAEEELGFDRRSKRECFPQDPLITWHKYLNDRKEKCSQEFVAEGLKYSGLGMYTLMSSVFVMFAISFMVLAFVVLWNTRQITATWVCVGSVAVTLSTMVAAYLVARRIGNTQ